ncbi:MAG: Crp/Fnr family transcriptional regulator [Chloroflexota bacterium]
MMDTQRLFAHLPEEIQTKVRSVMHVQTLEPGESIFHQGAPATAIYVVASGRVKVARVTPDGYESILCVRRSGDYFCPVPVLDGKAQLGTAIAMTEATLLWVECEAFHALCRECPQLLATVQGDCLAEVRYLLNRLETFTFRNIKERLAIALLDEIRHQHAEASGPIVLSMTQQELAGLVGASRESVSRNLTQMGQDGIVELRRGKVRILDAEKLRKIVAIE